MMRSIVLFCLLMISGTAALAQQKSITIASGGTLIHLLKDFTAEFNAESGLNVVHLNENGMNGESITIALDTGRADAGFVASDRDQKLEYLKEKKIKIKSADRLQTQPVGKDRIAIIAHKGSAKTLTADLVKKILTGQISNWRDVGGEGGEIKISYCMNAPVTKTFLEKNLLGGESVQTKGSKTLPTNDAVAEFVSTTKGTIGFVTHIPNPREVDVYYFPQLARALYFETIGPASPNVQILIDAFRKHMEKVNANAK